MLTRHIDWTIKTAAQKLDHLRGVEAELTLTRRLIPELVRHQEEPIQPRAWAALTDDQQLALVIELEMQRDNARDYLAHFADAPKRQEVVA